MLPVGFSQKAHTVYKFENVHGVLLLPNTELCVLSLPILCVWQGDWAEVEACFCLVSSP